MNPSELLVSAPEVESARRDLPGWIRRTPLIPLEGLPGVHLKCENLQATGSYKIRAAWTVLSRLPSDLARRGAALASSGNFAAAFARAGRELGIPTAVVMMEKSSPFKVERARAYGAEVVLCESRYEARFEALRALQEERGLVAVDHTESRDVLVGHGTVGLEIAEQLPEVEVVLVPVSTGGLVAGVAAALRALRPAARVIGVQPAGADAARRSLREGRIVTLPDVTTSCDALTATRPGRLPFRHMRALVEDVVSVEEDEVAEAVRRLARDARVVAEPGGAVGLAALLAGKVRLGGPACVLVSGGNVEPRRLAGLLQEG